jgi:ubiquinone/menaquinone biosynthesis C-methylase UbiE
MFKRKWHEVWERLPVERKDMSLGVISGFDKYCTDPQGLRMGVFNSLLAESALKKFGNVCEVGCGCGDKLTLFDKAGYKCFGVDYSANMITRAEQEIPGGTFHVSEAGVLPFADNSMDFIFSYSVFFYFENWAYAAQVLSEMYRIAKPQATICIWDVTDIKEQKNVESFRGTSSSGYEHTYYDMNDFIQWFKMKGVSCVKAEYVLLPFYKHSAHRFNVTAVVKKG